MDTEEKKLTAQENVPSPVEETAADPVPSAGEPEALKKNRSRMPKVLIIAGSVLLGLILLSGGAALLYFNRLYNLSNFRERKEASFASETLASEEEEETEEETGETIDEESVAASLAEEQRKIRESLQESRKASREAAGKTEKQTAETEETFLLQEDGITNILLIGMDVAGGNSDAIIICSIDYGAETIRLTSVMRDTVATVPGYGGARKINSACAAGGPELLVETVEQNYMIEIDNYAAVDFNAMKAMIDALGGVDMYITQKEAEFMKIEIPEDRVIHLTGKMALRHSRDRSSGNFDYGRTQRQKNVLLAIIEKARSGGLGDLNKAAEACLPYITHDFTRTQVLTIAMNLPELIGYEFLQSRIPYDGLYYSQDSFLVPDMAATIQRLHEEIYGAGSP